MNPEVKAGQIWRDDRDRWLRVDEATDGRAAMVVVAQQIGDRVMSPMRAVSMRTEQVARRMTLVESAPEATGPDLGTVTIDYPNQTIDLGAGPVPYYVGSSGPRVRFLESGTSHALVTVAFYVAVVHSNYGGGE